MIQKFRWLCFGLALVAGSASAQTIESFEWLPDAAGSVARITFNANVRFLRQAPAASTATDLAQLSFQIVAAEDTVQLQTVEEGKRLKAIADAPDIDISYVPVARAQTKLISVRLGAKALLLVRQGSGARTIDLVFNARSAIPEGPKLPDMAEAAAERRYAVVLQSAAGGAAAATPRIPAEFQNYAVYTQSPAGSNGVGYELMLGYFKTEQDAEVVRQRALRTFPTASVRSLSAPPQVASAPVTATPLPAVTPNPATAAVQPKVEVNVSDSDGKGIDLLAQGQKAFKEDRLQDAVDAFNMVLMLPPNAYTPVAQELIGRTWEALERPDKAITEYELYARLYPQGEAIDRVNQRIKAIKGAMQIARAPGATKNKSDKKRLSATGSVSQYYYGGQTKTDSLVNIASGIDQQTLTRTNQSVVVSSWDATGKYETDESITKLVMRGSRSDNLSSASATSTATQGLVSAAYVDYRDIASRTDVRLGRQSAIGGSLFGLFDGVSMATPVWESYKLDAMIGVPANTLINAPQQRLMGVMLEADNLFEHWGGNVSLVDQTTEDISDRRAVGLEVRYFGETVSMYTQLDYDLNFNAINAMTIQGSTQGPYDTTITMLLDDRKAPSLQLSDALISSGQPSLSTLLQTMSLSQAQAMALATAAQARQAMVSVSRALSPKWQGSVDFRYSEVGALPAIGNFQAQPATGAQYNVSLQLTGSNLYSSRDINGFNVSLLNSATVNGTQLAYNNLTGFMDNIISVEPSIRYYTQVDNTQTKVSRISPGLRVSYKLNNRASLMAEGIYETSQTDGPTNHETSESYFFYFGYRYDFQ